MFARPALVVTLLVFAGLLGLVQRASRPAPYSQEAVSELLGQAAQGVEGTHGATLAQALLAAPFAEERDGRAHLRLGHVWSAPTVARLAAEAAGELLALEAVGAEGPTGLPLWRVLLDGPATSGTGDARTLALYGCLQATDVEAGPAIEDTYVARQALAQALEQHARAAGFLLTLEGVDVPQRGGVNLEVQLQGLEHWIRVTFDGRRDLAYHARRSFRPAAPHDSAARASLCAALRAVAREEGCELVLEGEEAPLPDGTAIRLEPLDGRLTLSASRAQARLFGALGGPRSE